ncbi:MAG TPA: LytTR family DNA-binding domain-containing protein [Ferruginibacter sp.]|nr:LytTR family DNA-binding domain-containing protein [Ferruginibacter sp.]HMP21177.1 LytTR family DNA-binding domain-containing protein [Ferruginibacter sp.]
MKVFIIEDELPASNRLAKLLQQHSNSIVVVQKADSIEAAVRYFNTMPDIDLVFMDIQLADGLSFAIFEQAAVKAPVIFTTAFDQYTLKAFKVNSIDYLLKPIDEKELETALEKYYNLYQKPAHNFPDKILKMMQEMNLVKYKERLLIKRGQQLSYLKTTDTAYCYADGKLCYAVDFTGSKYLLENNMTQLEEQLEPVKFYRINRQLLVNIEAVKKVHTWLGGRLKVDIVPSANVETVVSRERVNGFKEWLGR